MTRYLIGTLWLGLVGSGLALGQSGAVPAYPLYSSGTGHPSSGTSPFLVSTPGNGEGNPPNPPMGSGSGAGVPMPPSPGTAAPPAAPLQSFGTGSAAATLTNTPTTGHENLPPGSVPSPWVGGHLLGSDCNGPIGGNGPIMSELYTRTGPSWIVGGDPGFSGASRFGWGVGGGARTLFFNTAYDAAWVVDLGLMYFYNRGDNDTVFQVLPRLRGNTGPTPDPNVPIASTLRSFRRTSFNYSIGREWFLNGPASQSCEAFWNQRIGVDVGGRWGTASANFDTLENPARYSRHHDVYHGFFLAANWHWERPFGGLMLFGGLRTEWGYNWVNLIPRQNTDIQDLNFLATVGFRF